jgi:hypothetical protein
MMRRYDLDEIAALMISLMFDHGRANLGKAAMSDNSRRLDVSIEGPCRPEKSGLVASTSSAPWIPRISHEILRDLGMSDDAIARYFCRFRHGQLEQIVQTVLHKRGWMCRRWRGYVMTKERHGQTGISHRADRDRDAV